MSRHLPKVLLVVLLALAAMAVRAADPIPFKGAPKKPGDVKGLEADPDLVQGEAASKQETLRRQFDDFKQSLLRLAQRLEASSKQEDRDKAATLKKAIALASEQGVDTKFTTLVASLKASDTFKNLEQLQVVMEKNEDLRKDLRNLIELLLQDDSEAEARRKREEYSRLLERLKGIIAAQERIRDQTGLGKKAVKVLEKDQNKVTNQTKDLVARKEDKDGTGKSNAKEGKGQGEAKDDAKDPKGDSRAKDDKGDSKDSKADGQEGKPGDGKDDKGDPKDGKGDGKEGKGEKNDGKPGSGKESKSADGKENKASAGKDDAKQGKPADVKVAKATDAKAGDPKTGKPNEGKGADGKEGKPADGKGSDSKAKGDGKGGSKGSGGDSKSAKSGDSKPSDSKGGKQGGQPGQQGQQGQAKGDQQPGGQQQQQPPTDQPPQESAQVKKQIQDATQDQKKAGEDLSKNNRPKAVDDQEEALRKLNAAKKLLEDLLRQLREEEIERLLAALQLRCEKMLGMQIAVRDGTVGLSKTVQANSDKKPTRADEQQSNVLSDKEDDIVREAAKALEIVKTEGSAVAFAEVFYQVRGDMMTVAGRLRKTDIGTVTVKIEDDIIDTLKEMIEALKKARQDNQKPRTPPMPGQAGPQADKSLIDMIAELKMIRSMQKRVNDRTEVYGREYEGEQAPAQNEMVQRELRDLGVRQDKIGRITSDIYKGKNKAN